MKVSDSIYQIKGVGEQTAKKLQKLNINTVFDLITHYPREYDDRRDIRKINQIQLGETNTIIAKVTAQPQIMKKGNLIIVKVRVKDATGSIFVAFYGQAYMKNSFYVGDTYVFSGKVTLKYNTVQMESPEIEKLIGKEAEEEVARIIPIYPTTYKLSQKVLRQFIQNTVEQLQSDFQDNLPISIRETYNLMGRLQAIRNIHFPESNEAFFEARRRIVFEELFMLQLGLMMIREGLHENHNGIVFKDDIFIEEFIKTLPFQLTNAQKKVYEEVKQDMLSGKVMNRLVQGDVGSGKTMIALLTILLAVKNGYQAAFMAPTEVLAMQHYESLTSLLEPFGIKVGVLVGSLTKKTKTKTLQEIKNKELDIIVGTHALIQESVEFGALGLVVTDEQHRFGVRQRVVLSEKGGNPDVLVMTATPIPRTLALILYGDLDISVVDELPPGRQKIRTDAVNSSYRHRIYEFIKKEIYKGRQAYIICPMVEESEENTDLKSVISYTQKLKDEAFKEIEIAYLHGKMKPKEKQEIMDAFVKNEIKVLISTTVIEVGVNVPNSTVMFIENAERFGLAQLHQLRGRVGRGSEQSYCILLTDSKSKVSKERMKVMKQTNDGFIISETDLKLRGPGEFFGTRQHGLPEMKIANLYKDISLLKLAQKATSNILEKDPHLEKEEHKVLKSEIIRLFHEKDMSVTL